MGTAALIGGGLGLAGSIIGSRSQSRASGRATEAQERAGEKAIAEQRAARRSFEKRTDPFRKAGVAATGDLRNFLADPTAGLEQANPLVSFLRDQGFEQIQESAAARGRLGAGGTLQDLAQFNLDIASTVVPQLRQQRFNELFNVASLGANTAAGQGTAGLQTASNIGNTLGNIGAAQAQNALNQGAATTGLIQNVGATLGAFPGMFGGGASTGGIAGPVGGQVFGLGNAAGAGGTGALSTFGL